MASVYILRWKRSRMLQREVENSYPCTGHIMFREILGTNFIRHKETENKKESTRWTEGVVFAYPSEALEVIPGI